MLIQSHRHKPEDLALWEEYADMDKFNITAKGFFDRLFEAKKLAKEFSEREKKSYLSVSWGKDSVVLLHLFYMLNIKTKVIYVRQLDNENPESHRIRDHFIARFPDIDYEEITYTYKDADETWYRNGKPDRWYQLLRELQRKYGCHITGIRSDESSKRKKRCCVFGEETINSFAPISWLKYTDIFAYLSLYHLPIHPNYAMLGGGRWPRERLRVAALGNIEGTGAGRREWEQEYYGDVLRRMETARR